VQGATTGIPTSPVSFAFLGVVSDIPILRVSFNEDSGNDDISIAGLYRQAAKAAEAIDRAFTPSAPDDRVLLYLPVTQPWLRQFVPAQVLIGHSSFRGVTEILDAVFDYRDISIGTIHNILADAVDTARRVNDAQDLSAIAVGAHDETYQAGRPVLVGADVRSTYCYLLAAEDHGDETTWGVHLLDLRDRGLGPRRTIADGGKALRAGQAAGERPEILARSPDGVTAAAFLRSRQALIADCGLRIADSSTS